MKSINWEVVLAFLGVVGVIFAFLRRILKMFIPTRKEFDSMLHKVNEIHRRSRNNTTEIDALHRERKSFREEVLVQVRDMRREVGDIRSDISELKNIMIGRS